MKLCFVQLGSCGMIGLGRSYAAVVDTVARSYETVGSAKLRTTLSLGLN